MKKNFQFSLAGILMFNNVLLLLLPLGMIYYLKFYENELLRQTQSELVAQAAFIASIYKNELTKYPVTALKGKDVEFQSKKNDLFQPVSLNLDLYKDPVLPSRPDGRAVNFEPDKLSLKIGRLLLPILLDAQRTTLSGMKILDYQGLVVSGRQELKLSFIHLPEIQDALKGKFVSVMRLRENENPKFALSSISRSGRINVYVAAPIIFNQKVVGVVYLSRTAKDLSKALYERRGRLMAVTFLLLFLATLSAVLTSLSITKPVAKLIEAMYQFSEGKKSLDLQKGFFTSQEIVILANSFQRMAEQIQIRSEHIRSFAMHVSHEFKTPLTTIQGTVELLDDHYDSMSEEERKNFMQIVKHDVQRLKRLVNRLLELARADILKPVPGNTSSLKEVLVSLTVQYEDSSLTIKTFVPLEDRQLKIAPELLETVLINLIENSKANGANSVCIKVKEAHQENAFLQLLVEDNGRGVASENVDKIFAPFYTTQKSAGGTGLGLSIVQSLLKAHNGSIRLVSAEEVSGGARFEIKLPCV